MARWVSDVVGTPVAFAIAVVFVVAWGLSGPFFGFSDTWQLIINTSTTILTFLMVFVIQSSQNRDTRALQVKLDELIRTNKGAHKALLDLEEMEDHELREIQQKFEKLAAKARRNGEDGVPKD
jgi:low affinity Fe/Cu permease